MLGLAVVFLLVALLAYFLGQGKVGAVAVNIAYACFAIFVILLLLSFIMSATTPGPYWGWPVYRGVP